MVSRNEWRGKKLERRGDEVMGAEIIRAKLHEEMDIQENPMNLAIGRNFLRPGSVERWMLGLGNRKVGCEFIRIHSLFLSYTRSILSIFLCIYTCVYDLQQNMIK